jgi:hypothetical protein
LAQHQSPDPRLTASVNIAGEYTVSTFASWLVERGISFTIPEQFLSKKGAVFINAQGKPLWDVMRSFAASVDGEWIQVGAIHVLRSTPIVPLGVSSDALAPATIGRPSAETIDFTVAEASEYAMPASNATAVVSYSVEHARRVRHLAPMPPLNLTTSQKNSFYVKSHLRLSELTPAQRKLVPPGRGTFIYQSGSVPVAVDRNR